MAEIAQGNNLAHCYILCHILISFYFYQTGRGTEVWTAQSTLLQILISIQGLILNATPYFNEAGYERQRTSTHGMENARMYNEMVLLKLVSAMSATVRNPPLIWEAETVEHFRRRAKNFANRLEFWARVSGTSGNSGVSGSSENVRGSGSCRVEEDVSGSGSCRVEGDISGSGSFRVEGDISGSESCRVKGKIEVERVSSCGVVGSEGIVNSGRNVEASRCGQIGGEVTAVSKLVEGVTDLGVKEATGGEVEGCQGVTSCEGRLKTGKGPPQSGSLDTKFGNDDEDGFVQLAKERTALERETKKGRENFEEVNVRNSEKAMCDKPNCDTNVEVKTELGVNCTKPSCDTNDQANVSVGCKNQTGCPSNGVVSPGNALGSHGNAPSVRSNGCYGDNAEFELPQFPLLPASRGFCLTLKSLIASFRTTIKRLGLDESSTGNRSEGGIEARISQNTNQSRAQVSAIDSRCTFSGSGGHTAVDSTNSTNAGNVIKTGNDVNISVTNTGDISDVKNSANLGDVTNTDKLTNIEADVNALTDNLDNVKNVTSDDTKCDTVINTNNNIIKPKQTLCDGCHGNEKRKMDSVNNNKI